MVRVNNRVSQPVMTIERRQAAKDLKLSMPQLKIGEIDRLGRPMLRALAARDIPALGIESPQAQGSAIYLALRSGLDSLARSKNPQVAAAGKTAISLMGNLGFTDLKEIFATEKLATKQAAEVNLEKAKDEVRLAAKTSVEEFTKVLLANRGVLANQVPELATEILEGLLQEAVNDGRPSNRILNNFKGEDANKAFNDMVVGLIAVGAKVNASWEGLDSSRVAIRSFNNDFYQAERLQVIIDDALLSKSTVAKDQAAPTQVLRERPGSLTA